VDSAGCEGYGLELMKMQRIALLLASAAAITGCSSKLETGYTPVKLGDLSAAQRRGLYAQEFTPEAQAAAADRKTDSADVPRSGMPGGQP
jgi:hypothetical protein